VQELRYSYAGEEEQGRENPVAPTAANTHIFEQRLDEGETWVLLTWFFHEGWPSKRSH
jgi:hypothetical protein